MEPDDDWRIDYSDQRDRGVQARMTIYGSKQTRRALIDTAIFRALSQIATVVSFIVLARSMPEEDFGVFSLLYAFIPVLSTVASLGLEQTLQRYQPEYLGSGNTPAARWLVDFVASARFGTNVVSLALILLAWNYIAPIFKLTPYRGEFAFFSLLVLLYFQANILQISLAANMLHRYSVGSVAAMSILKLVAYAGLAAMDSLTLIGAIVADTIAGAVAYALLVRAHCRHRPRPETASSYRPGADERRRLLRYGLLNNFNETGAWVLSSKSDNFFIAALLDPVAVGVYAFYSRLNQMVTHLQPLSLFLNVVQPLFFSVVKSEATQSIPKHFSLLLNTSMLMQWPVLAFSLAYHSEIVGFIFGGKFGDFSRLLPLIVSFGTLHVITGPVTLVAQYEEKAGILLASKIFALYNVAALLVLIPIAGLYGAVIATGSATLFKNLFVWWHVRQLARWLNFGKMIFWSLLIWSSALTVCLILKARLDIADWGHVLIGSVLCGATALLHVRTVGLADADRRTLATVLRGKEARWLQLAGVIRPTNRLP